MPSSTKPWQRPELLLFLMAFAVPLSFAAWQALLNNFAIERAAFTGKEMGVLQSLREVPGFLAFGVVFLLLIVREQSLAIISLLLLGLGTALTGFFPSVVGLYLTTVLMSIGFHYYETIQTSLTQQWIPKGQAAEIFGRLIAVGSLAAIIVFGTSFTSSYLGNTAPVNAEKKALTKTARVIIETNMPIMVRTGLN